MNVHQRPSDAEGPLHQVNKIINLDVSPFHQPPECFLSRLQGEVTMVTAAEAIYGFNNMDFSQRLTWLLSITSI